MNTIPTPRYAWQDVPVALADLTTERLATMLAAGSAVALLPVGSTEPHGPHLPVGTDAILSSEACHRAALALRAQGRPTVVAPVVAYGVTRYARGFRGAVGVSEATLVSMLDEIVCALLDDGFAHVAALERAVTAVAETRGPERVSFPNQLSKRWGRQLGDEFRRGDCHAGCYETSLVLAARPETVQVEEARRLPKVAVSLADAIRSSPDGGASLSFRELGMTRAYTGAPAEGTVEEGERSYGVLVTMIVTEVVEHLESAKDDTARGTIPPQV